MLKTKLIEEWDEYDGIPISHIRQADNGQKYYCHFLNYWEDRVDFAVTPISEEELQELASGQMPLRQILQKDEVYLLVWGEEEVIGDSRITVPEDFLPSEGITYKHLSAVNRAKGCSLKSFHWPDLE